MILNPMSLSQSLQYHVPQLLQTKLSISARPGSPTAPNIALEGFFSVSLVHSYSCSETQMRCHFLQEALFNPQAHIGTSSMLSLEPVYPFTEIIMLYCEMTIYLSVSLLPQMKNS